MLTESEFLAVIQSESSKFEKMDFEPSVLRFVLKFLRHGANGKRIPFDESGWISTDSIVDAINEKFQDYSHWQDYSARLLGRLVSRNLNRLENRGRNRYALDMAIALKE